MGKQIAIHNFAPLFVFSFRCIAQSNILCNHFFFFFQIKGTTVYRKFELHVPMNPVMILT